MSDNPIKYSDLISPDSSIKDLIKQLDELSDSYTNALKNIKAEAIELAATLNKVSGATEEGRKTTRKAADDADRLAKAQRDLAFAESENAKRLAELRAAAAEQNQINRLMVKLNQSAEGSYNRLSAQYSLNKIYINNMTKAERENTEEGRKLVEQTKEIYEEMKRLQEATGKHQLNVGNYTEASDAVIAYGERLKESLGLNSQFGESLLALGRGGTEAKGVFAAMASGAKTLGTTLLGLLSNPVFIAIAGIAAAGAAFKWWYDYNAGLQEATRLTQQFTGKEGDDLKNFRNEVQAIADTFGKDFRETLSAANSLAQQFGISADEALRLVQDGFIAGADVNGQFLDTLREYPAYFREAGITADQFVAIIAQTEKMGIFSDKGVDAIKEANLRLREMADATAEALDGIGISSTQVQKDLQTGAKTTFDVMQDVSARLAELPDSAASVGAAIADIFGGPGEDAGLQYLRTLKDISTDLDGVKDKAGVLGDLQEEQLQAQVELNNALASLFDQTGGNFETLTTKAKTFLTQGLTAIIKGAVSLLNYFIDLYNESVVFRGLWNGIIKAFKDGWSLVGNLIGFVVNQVKALGVVLKGALTLDFDAVKKGFADYTTNFKKLISAQVKDMQKSTEDYVKGFQKKVQPITIPVTVGDTPRQTTPTGGGRVTTATPTAKSGSTGGKKKDTSKQVEDAYKKNLEATRKLQDAELKLMADGYEKERREIELNYSRQIEDLRHQLDTEKNLTKTGREAILATITAIEKQKADELLKLEQDRQLQELETERKGIELRLSALREGSTQEIQLRRELIENQKQTALLKNAQLPEGERQDAALITASYDVDSDKLADDLVNAQLAAFDKQQELAQSEFDLLQSTEGQKTRFRLQAEKDRLNKILELNKSAGTKLSEVETQTIQNSIAKIDQEIEESEKEEKGKDIYSLFGLNLSDEKKEGINSSLSVATDALNQYMDAYVAAAEAKVAAANEEVDSAKTALQAEQEARANGYANNVATAQKELDLAKKNQEKALKEQEKAQKAQLALETVQQASNLVSASALIWSQLGFPGAIPAIAIMWASFAAAKVKAFQATKQQTESYGEGTVELLQGGSHQSGNDIDLGTKPDGTRRRAEGGEFFAVINKRNSRRFRRYIPNLINSLNDGTFAHKYLNAYNAGEGLTLNVSRETADLKDLSADVREIKEQNRRRTIVDGDGNVIETYKNLRRKIKR